MSVTMLTSNHERDEASPEGCGTPLTHTRLEAFILLVL